MRALALAFWLFSEQAYAQSPIATYCNILHPGCGAGRLFIIQIANRVIDMVAVLIVAFAATQIIKAGILLISSGYNEENRGKAKTYVQNALIGLFLAFVGRTVVFFVADFVSQYAPPL